MPSPAFLYPRRLALCGRLCAPLCGVLAAGSIGIAPPPGVALWGVYGRLWRCYSRGCGLLAPVRRCGRLCGLFRGLPVPLYPCPVAWLCAPSVAAVGVAVLWLCPLFRRGGCGLSSGTEKSPGKLYKLHPGAKEPPPGLHPGRLCGFIYSFSAIRTG